MESILTGLVALAFADFLTGVLHFIEDVYGSRAWGPWLWRNVVVPNRVHHELPFQMTQGSYWDRVQISVGIALAPFCAAVHFHHPYLALMLLFASQANQIHCWAHLPLTRVPWPVRLLQAFKVLQSKRHHAVHHKAPYAVRYCVMTPWLNPILDRVRFFTTLTLLLSCIGVYPAKEQDAI